MDRRTRQGFLLHSKTKEFKKKVKYSQKVINDCLKYFNPYVAFSGGKDSTVILHLTLNFKKNIPVWHWDYGDDLMPRSIEKEVQENLKKTGVENLVNDKRKGDGKDTSSGYKQFFKAVADNKNLYGWDCGIIGVRRAESARRKKLYNKPFQKGNCYPILDWSWMDVWAYIVQHDLPYPKVYEKYSQFHGWERSRFVTFFDPEFENLSMVDGVLLSEFRNK